MFVVVKSPDIVIIEGNHNIYNILIGQYLNDTLCPRGNIEPKGDQKNFLKKFTNLRGTCSG